MASASVTSVRSIRAELTLNGGPFTALTVLKFRYEEELGQPFAIEIELQVTNEDNFKKLSPERVVGRNLVVTISGETGPIRHFHAIMETFVAVDNHGAFNRYRGTAVPWYSLLKLAENSQIYPGTNAKTLLEKVYEDFQFSTETFGLRFTDGLTVSLWTTRTQYCETYFQFLQRSLQQEGLYYYWTHTSDQHVMNTTDGSDTPPSFLGENQRDYRTIDYLPSAGGNATEESIYEWSHEAAVQPLNFRLDDYNYGDSEKDSAQEIKSDLSGDFKSDSPFDKLEVFRHPGQNSKDDNNTKLHLNHLMQAFTCRQEFVRGKAVCVGLTAGHLFRPGWPTHINPYLSIKEFLPTKTILTLDWTNSSLPPKFECEFIAIPWDTKKRKYRPIYDATEPRIFGVQSAVVCAAESVKSEESSDNGQSSPPHPIPPIYCDYGKNPKDDKSGPYGRVKVKFHWCRGKNERTDWIRLTHLMAGNGWGEFHLPRPGDEVLVAFEHGDPDRPVIVGCLYNDKHAIPFDLGDTDNGANLKKLFAIKDPGGNLFIMDPGEETHAAHPESGKKQTISLRSPSTEHPSSVQIGHNAEESPGIPKQH